MLNLQDSNNYLHEYVQPMIAKCNELNFDPKHIKIILHDCDSKGTRWLKQFQLNEVKNIPNYLTIGSGKDSNAIVLYVLKRYVY